MRAISKYALKIAFAILLPPYACAANVLPAKPVPRTQVHVADREFKVTVGVFAGAWAADTASTARWVAACSRCVEGGGILNGSRNVPAIMGLWAAVDAGAVVGAYEWKAHVHNRYLHPLWRVPLYVGIAGHVRAVPGNMVAHNR